MTDNQDEHGSTQHGSTEHEATCSDGPLVLRDLGTSLLDEARAHHSRRAANTILSGSSLRATVIALVEGAELAEHEAPPAATLQVLSGDAELTAGDDSWPLTAGEIIAIPLRRHALRAHTDAVVLLTVALH